MDDVSQRSPGTRLATFVWCLLTIICLLFRPGQWLVSGEYATSTIAAWIGAISVVFLFILRVQGLGWALLTMIGLLCTGLPTSTDSVQAAFQLEGLMGLAAFGLMVIAWSEATRKVLSPVFWLIWSVAIITVMTAIWCEAAQTQRFRTPIAPVLMMALQRIRVMGVLFLPLAAIMGAILVPKGSTTGRISMVVVGILSPAIGFALANLMMPIDPQLLLMGADTIDLPRQWLGESSLWHDSAWAWTSPAVLLSIMLLALYPLFRRGLKMKRAGESPLPWLMIGYLVMMLAVYVAGPYPGASTPLPMHVFSIALPLFVFADLLISLLERLVRLPPEPGPARIPRVD